MPFEARYEPRRLRAGIAISVALFAVGAVTGGIGVWMGWVLAAFMLWTIWTQLRRYHRSAPVLTIDPGGATDHRLPRTIAWDEVTSMRTVDRRVVGVKMPLLELVAENRPIGDAKGLIGAVLRGDISFADARDRTRVMIDLRHLDATPEQVLAAARENRP